MSVQSLKVKSPIDLPTRQQQVLRLFSEGKTTIDIAHILGVSPKTVEYHRDKLEKKVGLDNYAQLTQLALRIGLIKISV